MNNEFDVYCNAKFSFSEPRFSRICTVDPVASLIGRERFVDENGYIGVSLSQLESLWLTKVLRRMGIDAYPVAKKYKTSEISAHEAMQVARNFVREKQDLSPDDGYAEVEEISLPWWLSTIAYGYFSKSEQMMRDGIAPGGITVCIDRFSGMVLDKRKLMDAELPIMLTE